jgi:hypothetical protein
MSFPTSSDMQTTIECVTDMVNKVVDAHADEVDELTRRLDEIKSLDMAKKDMEKTLASVDKEEKPVKVPSALEMANRITERRRLPDITIHAPKRDEKTSMKNSMPPEGMNEIMMASYWGHGDIIKVLVEAGGDVNAQTRDGITALMLASYMGFKDVVKVLVDHGADVNLKDHKGNSALMYAIIGMSDFE